MSSGIDQIIQTIHQILSDPALQGIGTIMSIAGSGIALLKSKSSQKPNRPHQRLPYLKKTFRLQKIQSCNATLQSLPFDIVSKNIKSREDREKHSNTRGIFIYSGDLLVAQNLLSIPVSRSAKL